MSGPARRLGDPVLAAGLVGVLFVSILGALTIGPAGLSAQDAWATVRAHVGVGTPPLPPTHDAIVWQLRLPRLLTAAAVGAGLGICGAVLQSLTRNPLADPYLLGLSSGASLGAVILIVLGLGFALPTAAFLGALAALGLTLLLSTSGGGISPARAILAGIAVSAFFGALTSFVIFWAATGDSYREILGWLLGSLGGASWGTAAIAAGAMVIIGIPILTASRALDSFALGDRMASSLGVAVGPTRAALLTATALLTAAMVSVSGAIGFVGLVVPHLVRLAGGTGHRRLLPYSALTGALLLLWADTLARSLFAPRELPVGIVTALIGAPVFALLLIRHRSRV